jgi:hypothetical protein
MRSFDYTVSDAFVMIRRQPCFARVSSAAIRRRMRESGVRRLTDPEGGKMKDRRRWPWPKSGWPHRSWLRTTAYALEDIAWVARDLPFQCHFCGCTENPLCDMDRVWFPTKGTIICTHCHKTKLRNVFGDLDALKPIVSELMRGLPYEGHSRLADDADCRPERPAGRPHHAG